MVKCVTIPKSWFALAGALSGIAVHHGAPDILRAYAAIFSCVVISRWILYQPWYAGELIPGFFLASFFYFLGLETSILWARYTKIWQIWENRHSKNHLYLHKLHQSYGNVVRTGPAEVTVFLPESHEASEFYDLLWPEQALFAARDRAAHARRRKDWQYGFSPSGLSYVLCLKHHDKKVLKWVAELDRQLEKNAKDGLVVDVTDFCLWYTFDIIGDFTFSKSFGMLETQRWHKIIDKTRNARTLLGPLTATPWLLYIGVKMLPRILWVRDWSESVEWCQAQMVERLSKGIQTEVPDLTSFFMAKNKGNVADPLLRGDSLLAILAGGEPTAQMLTAVFHELPMHPEHIDKIRQELGDVCITDNKALSLLPHLNAVIQEAMRLYPNLLTGGSRKTTENGVQIGDVYIPPHITVVTPYYTIAIREDCFEGGNQFIPERWTTGPEMVRNPKAHIPFSIGQYNCVGQHLAWRIMRYIIACVVWKYNFRIAPGFDGHNMEEDKVDKFTAFPGPVPLCFEMK
ncbi:cytochrome P450 [Xylariaceae sp. FL0804]|nr:cytochrome P450 [Xylariaceae sp. FL0804]